MPENTQPRSFIENVNTVANATVLATGDIIEDAQIARDEAVVAADRAKVSEVNADNSEYMSEQWAQKAYNSEITQDKFSAFHWAEVSRLEAADSLINDLVISTNYTWSSQQISTALNDKANTNHTHTNIYEPVITKNSAFNKNFSSNGTSIEVSREDHTHLNYEPSIGDKGTAFNKDFGTASGTVAEGSHSHPYEPTIVKNTAFNKNFVVDQANPLADEIQRATHTHIAEKIPYDNSGNSIITSGTVQGGMTQLDSQIGALNIYERANLTGGMTLASDSIGVSGVGVPTKVITGMNIGASSKNTLYSNGAIKVNYPSTPEKLIEGWYTFGMTIDREADTEYTVYMYRNDVVIDSSYTVKIGGVSTTTGLNNVSLDAFLAALENDDELSVYVSNDTNTNPIVISGFTVSFAGAPEGAVISSGTSIDHSDITGTGAANGVHTISDIKDLTTTLDTKTDKIIPVTSGNFAALDASGNLIDSGVESVTIGTSMKIINPATLDNIIVQTTEGDAKDGGLKLSDLALVGGSDTTTFNVATATLDTEAVTKLQLDDVIVNSASQDDFDTHRLDTTNPHSVTTTQIGAAATVHTHAIEDTLLLQDTLDNKYSEVNSPATDNIVAFETGGLLKDSGVSFDTIAANTALANSKVSSDTSGLTADSVVNQVVLDEAEYNSITPSIDTLYFIKEV